MVETSLTCQYCGEPFQTKSDLQDHEMNCLGTGKSEFQEQPQSTKPQQQPSGKQQQPSGKPQPQTAKQQQPSGKQQPQTAKQQQTGNKTRGAGRSLGESEEPGT